MKKMLVLILLVSVFSTASALSWDDPKNCVNLSVNLRQGMKDNTDTNAVYSLQFFLKRHGYLSVNPTGYFGVLTLNAVKAFQKSRDIPSTGFVGPMTRQAMKGLSCPAVTSVSPNVDIDTNITVNTVPVTSEVSTETPPPVISTEIPVPDMVLSGGTTSSLKVRTDGLVSVSQNTLTAKGTITAGARAGTQRWFELTKNPNLYMRSETITLTKKDQRTNDNFTDTFTGLEPSTMYYFRVCVENVSLGQKICGGTTSAKTNDISQ